MTHTTTRAGLSVDAGLAEFIENEALPGLPVTRDTFWDGFADLIGQFAARNDELLAFRDTLQTQIDDWHRTNGPVASDPAGYQVFLREIGYLVEEPADFEIETADLDPEIASICGPQLVVPVSNPRYALNAANARWGSLYDAYYGTDVIPHEGTLAPGREYNPKRGEAVFAKAAEFLDMAFPLDGASHADVTAYEMADGSEGKTLTARIGDRRAAFADPEAFAGYAERGEAEVFLLAHRGLHAELVIDRDHAIGKTHKAGLADIVVESAMTTIQDCEDSVAAVDAEDKIGVYRNWLGLMKGSLEDRFEKNGREVHRTLHPDRYYVAPGGEEVTLKGRALLLVRNVGHLMKTDAVLDHNGNPIGEGLLDAAVTVLCAMQDRLTGANSHTGAIYVVKPKMHGPEEVRFACEVFAMVEDILSLPRHTVKIGIMDEERRTSANLKAAIHAARHRVFFINTGFLDRTGDEIHTAMQAGPAPRKDRIKSEDWIKAYEDRNVLIGIACGLSGKAQIGKGMWPKPDEMAEMLATKATHPDQGANCAWVPSPTAATLHALHYHEVDVFAAQKRRHNEELPGLDALFSMPVIDPASLSKDEIARELENNAQGILGYVVRWIDQGVGCSKVPDINDVGLMEDRATLRISSQHIANWLAHGVVTPEEVDACLERMAAVVDKQNEGDPFYRPMAGHFDTSIAYQAARRLVFEGAEQPSGYTEPLLHAMRREAKAAG
ncbi:malate synthase G [Cucumibacter marinus]|uniref:malate synthase G n=1 Tax=Cucumibacter marinus TaxID=1121252 RepID=UPI000426DA59|nr:malate synthase G [Cucumibacter marinus]